MNPNDAQEIQLSDVKPIVSTTDLWGIIKYANKYFQKVSGYTEEELIGSPHNIIRHPDMPKVIFKLMWERIKKDKNILAIVKNRTKSGDYYWVTTLFETKYHPLTKNREGYLAIRKAAPRHAIEKIIPLYQKLLEIERHEGVEASEDYLIDFLVEQNMDYDTYVKDLVDNQGITTKFFNSIKKMFG
ncbi:PAS domain S-box protein [Sulfurimonas sp.]|uniref:PAS domain S-box protein n=1 Tax=Sulfurimonas sp. TaxID=2022749 RepID=UPI003D117C23